MIPSLSSKKIKEKYIKRKKEKKNWITLGKNTISKFLKVSNGSMKNYKSVSLNCFGLGVLDNLIISNLGVKKDYIKIKLPIIVTFYLLVHDTLMYAPKTYSPTCAMVTVGPSLSHLL